MSKEEGMTEKLTLYLTPTFHEMIKKEAKRRGETKTGFIRYAINRLMDEQRMLEFESKL